MTLISKGHIFQVFDIFNTLLSETVIIYTTIQKHLAISILVWFVFSLILIPVVFLV